MLSAILRQAVRLPSILPIHVISYPNGQVIFDKDKDKEICSSLFKLKGFWQIYVKRFPRFDKMLQICKKLIFMVIDRTIIVQNIEKVL